MKMIKFGVAIIGMLMSTTILAGTYDDATAALTAGTVTDTDCGVLSSAAKVNLSTGVVAALHCRSIYGDAIVGTCHTKGNVNPTTETCACNDVSATATPSYQKNISTCPGTCDAVTGAYTASDASGTDTVLLAGRKGFGASTSGGQLLSYSLGDTGLCDDTNLSAISLFP